jgi:polyisoprenoid-binding protein YceI
MRLKLLIGVPLALLVAVVGGSWFYIKVLEDDPPAKLSIDDTAATSSTTIASGSDDGTTDGTWKASSDSIVGYRVKETLFGASAEAVGRTNEIDGSLTINGTTVSTAKFTVDMTTVSSDRTQRDGQFRNRIMNTSQFPTSTFELTKPITLTSLDKDKEITASATGKLTLHGVTKTVTFDVVAKRVTGAIKVNGSIPVHFSDYEINDPSGGPAQVGDDGTLEFTLVFTR